MRRVSVRLSTWLVGSLATASIAHASIFFASRFVPNAYQEHAHGEAAVLTLAVATILSIVWLVAVARAFAGRGDAVCALSRDLRRTNLTRAALSTALGGALALAGTESLEQLAASGHVGTLATMLGGNAFFGALALLVAAFALVALGRSIAARVFASTAQSAGVWLSWVATSFARTGSRARCDAWYSREVRARTSTTRAIFQRSNRGLRAPPRYAGNVPT